jgi:hypothetical protein
MAVLALAAGCDGIELEQLVTHPPARTRVTPEPPGVHCPHGGSALLSGLDQDGNGVLDDSEVTSTEYACATALSRVRPEPAGTNCALGGQAVRTGVDVDGSGQLDDAEVTATEYLCATAMPSVLMRAQAVPPGERCPQGGQVSRAGHDTNGNGVLEDGEITREVYGCTQPETVVARVRAFLPPPFVCQGPTTVVEAGPDVDGDGALDDGEARARVTLCEWVDEVRVKLLPEPAGTRCPAGGTQVVAGRDVNADGELGDEEPSSAAYVCQSLHTYDGSYVVTSAADLAALQGISRLRGHLSVTGTTLTEVVLPGLVAVEGQLRIGDNADLTRLELPNLRFVRRGLIVESHPRLETLVLGGTSGEPLWIETSLELTSNPKLESLSGLTFVSPRQSLYLRDNDALRFIPGQASFWSVEALTGTLIVSGNDALTALPFPVLGQVGGNVQVVENAALQDLALTRLRSVGGELLLTNNDVLRDLSGLPLLETVNGTLNVSDNDALTSTAGLESLSQVGSLVLYVNPGLEWVGDMPQLRSIRFHFEASHHPKLLGVRNLGNLQQVRGMSFTHNPLLSGVALPGVRRLEALSAQRNEALTSLAGLAGLQEVGTLNVEENPALTRLGLDALARVSEQLFVTHNPRLPTCLATRLAAVAYAGAPNKLRINDNDDTATCGD